MVESRSIERYAMSVTGPINVTDLGKTLVHEHLLVDFLESRSRESSPVALTDSDKWTAPISLSNYYEMRWNPAEYSVALGLHDSQQAIDAIHLLVEHGGKSIVEVTPIGVGRNPAGLRELSEITGLTIVMGTGFLTREFHPSYLDDMTEGAIASLLIEECVDGVGPSKIRPGVIGEIGLSWPADSREVSVLNAAVMAQNEVGLPLSIHPGRHPSAPLEAARLVQNAGGDTARVAIGHLERTLFSISELVALAETGVRLEFDLFGQESRHYPYGDVDIPNDGGRIAMIAELFHRGRGDQVLISHDVSSPLRLSANGGEGYHHIFKRVLPVMARRGFSNQELEMIVVENPAAFLAARPGSVQGMATSQ